MTNIIFDFIIFQALTKLPEEFTSMCSRNSTPKKYIFVIFQCFKMTMEMFDQEER